VLVNKEYAVDESFDPGKIVEIDSSYTNGGKKIEIEENVKVAVEAMIDEMRAEGIEGICVTSGYRSYVYQEWLFNTYIENEKEKDPSLPTRKLRKRCLSIPRDPEQASITRDFVLTCGYLL
jgi:LAS superfamily LD-carboxypeptidase LdcB